MNKTVSFALSHFFRYCLLILTICIGASSCKKDSFITSGDARISTSVDSLKYDTVFTSIGSITQSFKISNLNAQKLLVDKVKLMGGSASSFTININGYATSELSGVEIAAGDSMYVFVTATINPNTANLPFIVRDSIQILYNGNTRFVQLEAFGQNANFLRDRVLRGDITWSNNLPYVILGSLVVDTTASLTIESGCRIYAHADAPIIIDGTLMVHGTSQERVVFASDRLDEDYRDFPASWPGIYFRGSSKNNLLKFATVKNAYQAIVSEQPSVNGNPKVTIQQSIIDNAYDAGILGVNSSIAVSNSLISNCGRNVQFIYGGDYALTNCTVASYSTFVSHKDPVLSVNNFASLNGALITTDLSATFRNCIFWSGDGTIDNELSIEKQGTNMFTVTFDHCLYKAATDPANSNYNMVIKNQDPLFDSVDVAKGIFDFHITKNNGAPGINKGVPTGMMKDLDDNPRNVAAPDLGCYEKQ